MLEAKKERIKTVFKTAALAFAFTVSLASLSRSLKAEDIYSKNSVTKGRKPTVTAVAQIPGETPINPNINLPATQTLQSEKKEKGDLGVVKASTYFTNDGINYKFTLETDDQIKKVKVFLNDYYRYTIETSTDALYYGLTFENISFTFSKPLSSWVISGCASNKMYYALLVKGIYDKANMTEIDTELLTENAKFTVEFIPPRNYKITRKIENATEKSIYFDDEGNVLVR